ncbi:MAG: helix-turn-helix domain-containing protein, partial [Saprospiraceae bacterium]|nr:helix-turn-helix domain-containing protein [Saprospiraceae bacterium]
TRRNILSMLQKSPLTTGEISDRIDDLSRYAVMKHLGVLEDASLIRTRREGKFRWNYLNAIPLQQSYEQWLRHLVQLAQQTKPTMGTAKETIMTATFSFDQLLDVPINRVWQALTAEISSWWPRKLLYYQNAESRLQLELFAGGRLFESASGQKEYLWAHVLGIDAKRTLLLKGQLIPDLGGPALSFLQFDLEKASGKRSRLKFSVTLLGNFSQSTVDEQKDLWERIVKKHLVQFLKN